MAKLTFGNLSETVYRIFLKPHRGEIKSGFERISRGKLERLITFLNSLTHNEKKERPFPDLNYFANGVEFFFSITVKMQKCISYAAISLDAMKINLYILRRK